MSDRQELADAVTTVQGVNCSPYYRQVTKPGEAFVQLLRKDAASNGFGMVTTWQIWIVLPQDKAAAEKWIDENDAALRAALKREWVGTSVQPATSTIDGAEINVVIYEGTR